MIVPRIRWTELQAGPLRVGVANGELRYVRLGRTEILRRVYVGVRDRCWNTLPLQISHLQTHSEATQFRVTFTATHQQDEIDFIWQGTIIGTSTGTISFTMEGEAQRAFLCNRIGLCILYPPRECAGQPCQIEHCDGTSEENAFPYFIAPHQPFKNIRAIKHEVLPGLSAEVRLTGEIFEIEDQRNWTDDSYKVYGPPLDLPFPIAMRQGEKIVQSCTLTLQGEMPFPTCIEEDETIAIRFDESAVTRLPNIGLGAASHGHPLSAHELRCLRLLHLSHLRVDLKLQQPNYQIALARASSEARELGAKLEVALFLSDAAVTQLQELKRAAARLNAPVARWLIFHEAEKVTAEKWIELAREILAAGDPNVSIGAGTNQYFTELNRQRPTPQAADVFCYSLNPQVHAMDEDSLLETLAAQGETVKSARQFLNDKPLAISPITLKPRFNPHATGKMKIEPDRLPAAVDARQPSLFAAVWTLGSLKYLAESGVASMTYYETTGWRGVMETEHGTPEPKLFPSSPGQVFPLWQVLAAAGEFAGGEVIRTTSSEPLKVIGLALRQAEKRRLILANLSGDSQAVGLEQMESTVQVQRLNEGNLTKAVSDPENFRRQPPTLLMPTQSRMQLSLLPHEIVTLDWL